MALECLAVLIAKGRRPGGLSGAELGQLRGFLAEMGASPASRAGCCRWGPAPSRPGAIRGTCRRRAPRGGPDKALAHERERAAGLS